MTGADIGMTEAGIGKTRGAGSSNHTTTIPALAALWRWWTGSRQWTGFRRMAAVPGNAAGVRALSGSGRTSPVPEQCLGQAGGFGVTGANLGMKGAGIGKTHGRVR